MKLLDMCENIGVLNTTAKKKTYSRTRVLYKSFVAHLWHTNLSSKFKKVGMSWPCRLRFTF